MGKGKHSSHQDQPNKHLSFLLRFYIYGLHGYFIEVTFTALYDFILVAPDWKLSGNSSIWSLGIYGACGLMLEESSYILRRHGIPIWLRALIYLFVTYAWEFSCGAVLSYLGACPWDYSEFRFNIGGLITLEYAPFWLMAGLVTERMLIGRLEQLQWSSEDDYSIKHNDITKAVNGSSNGAAIPKKRLSRKL